MVDDGFRHRAGIAFGVGGQHLGGGAAQREVALHEHAATDRVSRVELVGGVGLQCDGRVALVRILRDAVVQEVTERVGRERQARVAADDGGLPVELALRVLEAQEAEVGDLALVLVEVLARIGRLSVHVQAQRWLQAALVRNLERAD